MKLARTVLMLGLFVHAALSQCVCGDVVVLRGGAKIEGVILDHRCDEQRVVIRAGQKEITITRSRLEDAERSGTPAERYQELLNGYGKQLEDQWQLALWCHANELFEEESQHLTCCLQLAPQFSAAKQQRQQLVDERRLQQPNPSSRKTELAQGQAKVVVEQRPGPIDAAGNDARPEQLAGGDLRDTALRDKPAAKRLAALRREAAELQKRQNVERTVVRLLAQLRAQSGKVTASARRELRDLADPLAIAPLLKSMATLSDRDRALVTEVFGKVAVDEGDQALAVVAVADNSADVRAVAAEQLKSRGAKPPTYGPVVVRGLRSEQPGLIYNAAELCTALDEKAAVPLLVDSLATPVASTVALSAWSYSEVWTPTPIGPLPAGVLRDPAVNGPPIWAGFQAPAGPYLFSPLFDPVNVWVAMGTGPEMDPERYRRLVPNDIVWPTLSLAPGLSLQQGVHHRYVKTDAGWQGYRLMSARFALNIRRPPHEEVVVSLQRHEPVLNALRTLTGRDFGYDQQAWRRWLSNGGAQMLGIPPQELALDEQPGPRTRPNVARPPKVVKHSTREGE